MLLIIVLLLMVAPLLQPAPFTLHHDFWNSFQLRAEDVVVDPRDRKLLVTNWNKEGGDTGAMEAVLDYEKVCHPTGTKLSVDYRATKCDVITLIKAPATLQLASSHLFCIAF